MKNVGNVRLRQSQMVRSNAEQTEATVGRLIAISREHFARKGYAAVSIEEIVNDAGVTRGALYHHFKSKEALFEAVFLQLQIEIGERIKRSTQDEPDTWRALLLGCKAFLSAASQPDVQRIVLNDAPAVLGLDAWRMADETHSTHRLRRRLKHLTAAGYVPGINPDALTSLLNGALNDGALFIANAESKTVAFDEVCVALEALFNGLRHYEAQPLGASRS